MYYPKGKIVKVRNGNLRVITNNIPREILSYWQLTDAEKKELDYRTEDDGASFIRYRGQILDTEIFIRGSGFDTWDGASADTFFSGVCIRFVDDDCVIMGHYYQADSD